MQFLQELLKMFVCHGHYSQKKKLDDEKNINLAALLKTVYTTMDS